MQKFIFIYLSNSSVGYKTCSLLGFHGIYFISFQHSDISQVCIPFKVKKLFKSEKTHWDVFFIYIMQGKGTLKTDGGISIQDSSSNIGFRMATLLIPDPFKLAQCTFQAWRDQLQLNHRYISQRNKCFIEVLEPTDLNLYSLKSDRIQVQRHENKRHRLFY